MNGERVFINYRREDTAAESGRLFDWLVRRYGRGQVFRDLDGSPPGVSFPDLLRQTVSSCQVVLVLIGRQWLAELRRRESWDDWVRFEIRIALQGGVPVIPVLFEGVPMPRPDELPPDLQALSTITAVEVTESRWEYDTSRLVQAVDRVMGATAPLAPGPPAGRVEPAVPPRVGRTVGVGCAITFVVVLALLGAIGFGVFFIAGSRFPGGGTAAITLSPTTGPGGSAVQVTGSGFQPNETVQVFFQGGLTAQTTADGSGSFSVRVNVPANLGSFHGQQMTVTADGRSSVRSADAIFTIA